MSVKYKKQDKKGWQAEAPEQKDFQIKEEEEHGPRSI